MIYTDKYYSPLGEITLAGTGTHLTGLWFAGQKYFAENQTIEKYVRDSDTFVKLRSWLDMYFCGICPDFMPDVELDGTPFQLLVWNILKRIPYGRVVTYKDIACEAANLMGIASMSAQAVGNAVGRNPVSIIVPCHRVIGCGGTLTGYAGGIDKKVSLLQLEHIDVSSLKCPK